MEITRHTRVDDLPEMVTAEELAAWLGIGRSLAYDLIRREEVASVKFGRLVRVPRTALIALAKGAARG